MMKKICSLLVLVIVMAISSVCLAHSMPIEEFAVGGVRQGQTMSEVFKLMGQPSSINKNYIGEFCMYNYTYNYNGGMEMSGWTQKANATPNDVRVRRVVSTSKNYATPSGFRVGDNYGKVAQKFGQGSRVSSGTANLTYYCYTIGGKELSFLVNNNNIIVKINLAAEV